MLEVCKWRRMFAVLTILPAFALAGDQILIPLPPGRTVAGAFGSQWKSELWVYNGGTTPATLALHPGLAGQVFVVPSKGSLELAGNEIVSQPPAVLDLQDGSDVHVQMQVRELTRGDAAGVVVPTVALDHFSVEPQQLLNIPVQTVYRTNIRIYAQFTRDAVAGFTVRLFDMDHDGQSVKERHVTVGAPLPLPPAYVGVSVGFSIVSDFLDSAGPIPHGRLEVIADEPTEFPFWAFASVTNNSTQQVLIVAPEAQATRE